MDHTPTLPTNIQQRILYFMINSLDFNTLKAANRVSKLWNNTIHDLSRPFLTRYFPGLKTTKSETWEKNPFKLLADNCLEYNDIEIFNPLYQQMPLILATLNGNLAA